jgi:hypothetical protein
MCVQVCDGGCRAHAVRGSSSVDVGRPIMPLSRVQPTGARGRCGTKEATHGSGRECEWFNCQCFGCNGSVAFDAPRSDGMGVGRPGPERDARARRLRQQQSAPDGTRSQGNPEREGDGRPTSLLRLRCTAGLGRERAISRAVPAFVRAGRRARTVAVDDIRHSVTGIDTSGSPSLLANTRVKPR